MSTTENPERVRLTDLTLSPSAVRRIEAVVDADLRSPLLPLTMALPGLAGVGFLGVGAAAVLNGLPLLSIRDGGILAGLAIIGFGLLCGVFGLLTLAAVSRGLRALRRADAS